MNPLTPEPPAVQIPRDKQLHLAAGGTISLLVSFGVAGLSGSTIAGAAAGVVVASLAGFGKEKWDSQGHGHVEFADYAYTLLGGVLSAAFFLGIMGVT